MRPILLDSRQARSVDIEMRLSGRALTFPLKSIIIITRK